MIEKKNLLNLLTDPIFKELEIEQKPPNIFNILSISKMEIRHSNFLAWLLDPNRNHGLGNIFLKKILRSILFESTIESRLDEMDVDNFNYSNVDVRREWNNIDILIIMSDIKLIVCIENKVKSKDRSKQLIDYKEKIDKIYTENYQKEFIYLTPFGDDPLDEDARNHYSNFSYEKIENIIAQILKANEDNINSKVINYIKDYQLILKEDVLENSDLIKKAQKLYLNHKDVFEFIFENKPDKQLKVKEILIEIIKTNEIIKLDDSNKTYIRFNFLKFSNVLQIGTGLPTTRSILFFEFRNRDNLSLHLVLGPSQKKERQMIFIRAKNNLKLFEDLYNIKKKELSPKWHSIFSKEILSKDNYYNLDETEIQNLITQKLDELSKDLFKMYSILVDKLS